MEFIKENLYALIAILLNVIMLVSYIIYWFKNTTYKIDCLRLKEYEWDDFEIEVIKLNFSDRIVYKFKTGKYLGNKIRIENNVFEKQPLTELGEKEYTYISEKCF